MQGRAQAVAVPTRPEAAAERLYAQHRSRVYNFCLYRLRDRQDAEDAVQTTFMHAFGSLRKGVVPRAEAAWLLTIARNVCIARWRSARHRTGHEVPGDPQTLELVPGRAESDPLDIRELEQALGRLPDQQRRAILLREWQGFSYQEIADDLGTSVSAVEALIFRARRGLADDLAGRSRRRGLDLGSLLAGLKTLLGGGAVKVAASAAILAAGGVVAGEAVGRQHSPSVRPAHSRPAVAPDQARLPSSVQAERASSHHAGLPTRGSAPGARKHGSKPTSGTAGQVPTPGVAPGETPTVAKPPAQPGAGVTVPPLPATPPVGVPPAPVVQVPPVSVPAVPVPPVPVPALPSVPTPTVPSVPGVTVPSP